MKKIALSFSLFFIVLFANAQNTATTVWTAAFGLQDTVLKIPTVVDGLKNLYVAGSTIDASTGPNILLAKYDENGNPKWNVTYSGAGYHRDQATAIAIDNNFKYYFRWIYLYQ